MTTGAQLAENIRKQFDADRDDVRAAEIASLAERLLLARTDGRLREDWKSWAQAEINLAFEIAYMFLAERDRRRS